MLKKKRLFSEDKLSVMRKPQYKILNEVAEDARKELSGWLAQEYNLRGYQTQPISEEAVSCVIKARKNAIAPSAPDVFLNRADVLQLVLSDAKELCSSMRASGGIDEILEAAAKQEERDEYGL